MDKLDDQISVTGGTLGYRRVFAGGSVGLGEGNFLGAVEVQHYDGPWVNPDDLHKINAVLRCSTGADRDGFASTAMHYHGTWNATTDQPERAIDEGRISPYGSLDPRDGGEAPRTSLTLEYFKPIAEGELRANAYLFGNRLTLRNDFTHFLVDPVNGDQEAQHERRTAVGGTVGYEHAAPIVGLQNDVLVGLTTRADSNDVSRYPTKDRAVIPAINDPLHFSEADSVRLTSVAASAQTATHWTDWFRTVIKYRYDTQYGSDVGTNARTASGHLLAPKGSLIFRPAEATEIYLGAGRGFHSDDLRGVTAAQNAAPAGAPLIAR